MFPCIFNSVYTCAPARLSPRRCQAAGMEVLGKGGQRGLFIYIYIFHFPVSVPFILSSLFLSIYPSMNPSRPLPLTPAGWVAVILTNKSWQLCARANINASLPGRPGLWECFNKAVCRGLLIYQPQAGRLKAGRILVLLFFPPLSKPPSPPTRWGW